MRDSASPTFKSMNDSRRLRSEGSPAAPSTGPEERVRSDAPVPPSSAMGLAEVSCEGSSWDLLTGIDLVESTPDTLFDEFFDSGTGTARELAPSGDLSKDQWLLAFAVKLAELDRHLEPAEVIRVARALWRKKQHLQPEVVARDVYGTGWMLRRAQSRDRSRSSPIT